MKTIIKTVIILFLFSNCKAQTIVNINTLNSGDNSGKYFKDINNNYQKFTGTWENTTGNITFRLFLWKVTKDPIGSLPSYYMDTIGGSFKIIQNAGTTNEVVLHNSVKYYPVNDLTSDSVVKSSAWNERDLSGYFEDNCASGGNETLPGFFYLYITNPGITPSLAEWKVKERGTQGRTYSVPTNVIMTKVN